MRCPKRVQAYEAALEALLKVLRRNRKGLSAVELAVLLECSKPTVYSHLGELKSRGCRLETTKRRVGERGPSATVFVLKAEPA